MPPKSSKSPSPPADMRPTSPARAGQTSVSVTVVPTAGTPPPPWSHSPDSPMRSFKGQSQGLLAVQSLLSDARAKLENISPVVKPREGQASPAAEAVLKSRRAAARRPAAADGAGAAVTKTAAVHLDKRLGEITPELAAKRKKQAQRLRKHYTR